MPLVHVYWNSLKVSAADIKEIEAALPPVVARVLSVSPESTFWPSEVTVKSFPMEKRGDYPTEQDDLREFISNDVGIVIWAHNYPERETIKDEIAEEIRGMVQALTRASCSGFAWLLLQPSGFSCFASGSRPDA